MPDLRKIYHYLGQLSMAQKILNPLDIARLNTLVLTEEALATSMLEGELLQRKDIQASIEKVFRLERTSPLSSTVKTEALIDLLLDVRRSDEPLTPPRLFAWHKALFPLQQSGLHKIQTGLYRDDAQGEVKIISGTWEKETLHYLTPPADTVELEMSRFLLWLNTEETIDVVLKSAIAHIWFLMIHPFDDGNRRLARDISDYVLSGSSDIPSGFFAIAPEIYTFKKEYYEALDKVCIKEDADITVWIEWFVKTLEVSLQNALARVQELHAKALFWDKIQDIPLNKRQRWLLSKMLDFSDPFQKVQTALYSISFKVSKPTASRDLKDLQKKGVLDPHGAGRGVYYTLRQLR